MKKDGAKKERVFVYGTLLSGEHNDHFLESAEFIGNGILTGEFKMIDLGAYPAVVREDGYLGQIKGEVYEVSLGTLLGSLDRLEGIDRNDPENFNGENKGLYYRRRVNVLVEGVGITYPWVYLMQAPRHHNDDVIESGSWRLRNEAAA